jgi:hypothetical protein
MKTPQRLLCCALAVMLSSTGWARIGWTLDQCIATYGEATPSDGSGRVWEMAAMDSGFKAPPSAQAFTFQRGTITVAVGLVDGVVQMIAYMKPRDGSVDFTEADFQGLLQRNYPGGWTKQEDSPYFSISANREMQARLCADRKNACIWINTSLWRAAAPSYKGLLRERLERERPPDTPIDGL